MKIITFRGTISNEDLFEILSCRNLQEVEQKIPKKNIKIAEEILNSDDPDSSLCTILNNEYNTMTPDEISANLEEFLDNNIFDKIIYRALPDSNYLWKLFNKHMEYQEQIITSLNQNDYFSHINQNGIASKSIIKCLSNYSSIACNIQYIESDYNRLYLLLNSIKIDSALLPYIKDTFYKIQLLKAIHGHEKSELLKDVEEYNNHLKLLEQISDKNSKLEYVSKISNKDIKQVLISKVREKEIREEFEIMTPDEILANLEEHINNGTFDRTIFEALPNSQYLWEIFNKYEDKRERIISQLYMEDIFSHLNQNGIASEHIINYIIRYWDVNSIHYTISSVKSDYIRFDLAFKSKKLDFLPYIEDKYYRFQLIKQIYGFEESDLLKDIEEYNTHLRTLEQMDDEASKTEYISKIADRDMKEFLLDIIKDRANRATIIRSFNRNVDHEIQDLDKLVQKMIQEFFEDSLGEKFTDDKREKMSIIFARADVNFSALDEKFNAIAEYNSISIKISNSCRHTEISLLLGTIAHEYEHLFSISNFRFTYTKPIETFEEGIADIFAEVVINHYLNKHGQIELGGKIIEIDNPYITSSGYNLENAMPRTILSMLEKNNEDKLALSEYSLGSKMNFLEMALGKKKAKTMQRTMFGMPYIDLSIKDIYYSSNLDFSEIDTKSLYYNRNYILPLFQILNRWFTDKSCIDNVLEQNNRDATSTILDTFFKGRKFSKIPGEEHIEFINLLFAQIAPEPRKIKLLKNYIVEFYYEQIISEKCEPSFKILTIIGMLRRNENRWTVDSVFGDIIFSAIRKEINNIEDGQSIEETIRKKRMLEDCYPVIFHPEDEETMYSNHLFLKYCYLCEQAEAEKNPNLISSPIIEEIARQRSVALKIDTAQEVLIPLCSRRTPTANVHNAKN